MVVRAIVESSGVPGKKINIKLFRVQFLKWMFHELKLLSISRVHLIKHTLKCFQYRSSLLAKEELGGAFHLKGCLPASCTERCSVGLFESDELANSYEMKVLCRGEKPIAIFIL